MHRTLIKVLLHDRGEDVETVWAEPCGSTEDGAPLYRLVTIPFLHAKPTWGDVVVAVPDADLQWDRVWNRDGTPFEHISGRIHEDGGRYAAILDYHDSRGAALDELVRWLRDVHDTHAEGCYAPRPDKLGRMYLAVPSRIAAAALREAIRERFGSNGLEWIHPND